MPIKSRRGEQDMEDGPKKKGGMSSLESYDQTKQKTLGVEKKEEKIVAAGIKTSTKGKKTGEKEVKKRETGGLTWEKHGKFIAGGAEGRLNKKHVFCLASGNGGGKKQKKESLGTNENSRLEQRSDFVTIKITPIPRRVGRGQLVLTYNRTRRNQAKDCFLTYTPPKKKDA